MNALLLVVLILFLTPGTAFGAPKDCGNGPAQFPGKGQPQGGHWERCQTPPPPVVHPPAPVPPPKAKVNTNPPPAPSPSPSPSPTVVAVVPEVAAAVQETAKRVAREVERRTRPLRDSPRLPPVTIEKQDGQGFAWGLLAFALGLAVAVPVALAPVHPPNR